MKVFGYFIEEECRDGNWKLAKVLRGGLAFSHLFFTDDLFLFDEVTEAGCHLVVDTLKSFCEEFEQKVNFG